MRLHPMRWLMPATFALATAAVAAPGAPGPDVDRRVADPLDATAKLPPLAYKSVLGSYKRLAETEPVPWRQANDRVARIGGWRAYAREANAPAAAASAAPAPQPAAMPMPHGGHKQP